jgi:hypothetical protein
VHRACEDVQAIFLEFWHFKILLNMHFKKNGSICTQSENITPEIGMLEPDHLFPQEDIM